MSRVRSTLDTVSKAVSGTHTELLSKIARLKPKGLNKAEASVETTPKPEENAVKATPVLTNAVPPSTSTTPKPTSNPSPVSPPSPSSTAAADSSATTSDRNSAQANATDTVVTVRELREKRLRRVVPAVKASFDRKEEELKSTENKSTTSKQTTALFHPSTFSVSLDETYNYVAHHINSYFGSSTKPQDKKVDDVDYSSASSQGQQTNDLIPVSDKRDSAAPVTPPSSKKGLGHYLSYSAPTVQAFVGSYIAPLVPKFRTGESKIAQVEDKKFEDLAVKQVEATLSKEQKAAEEKAKKLLLQREKVGQQQGSIDFIILSFLLDYESDSFYL